jgi:hypothetical protein
VSAFSANSAALAFVWTFIALPVFLVNWFLYIYRRHARRTSSSGAAMRNNRFPMKSLKALLIPILVSFGVCFLSVSNAREQLSKRINSLGSGYTIAVNGEIAGSRKAILDALHGLYWEWGHHSHPTKKINLAISDPSGRIILALARDSEYPQEYWVFLPKYWITSKTDIGRIKNSAFHNY